MAIVFITTLVLGLNIMTEGMMHSTDPMMLSQNLILAPAPETLVRVDTIAGNVVIRASTGGSSILWPRYWHIMYNHVSLSRELRRWHVRPTQGGTFTLQAKSVTSRCARLCGPTTKRWDCYENGYLTVPSSSSRQGGPHPAVVQMCSESRRSAAEEFMAFVDPMDPHSVYLQSAASGYWVTWSAFRELTLEPLDYPKHSFRFEYVDDDASSTEHTEERVTQDVHDRKDDINPYYLRSSMIN